MEGQPKLEIRKCKSNIGMIILIIILLIIVFCILSLCIISIYNTTKKYSECKTENEELSSKTCPECKPVEQKMIDVTLPTGVYRA